MNIRLKKKFVLGLYTYLRQMELSVDRVLQDSWGKLIIYFDERISPQKVITLLESHVIDKSRLCKNSGEKLIEINYSEKLEARIMSVFGKFPYLTDLELSKIYSALQTFSKLLESKKTPPNDMLIQLRMQLHSYCKSLALKLNNRDLKRAQSVEHFNQNDALEFVPLEEIIGAKWG